MIFLQSIAVTALALCGAVRNALHHSSPRLPLQDIIERGQGGYAALLTTLHVTGVAISGSSRSLDDIRDASVTALYTICALTNDTITNTTLSTPCPVSSSPIFTVAPYSGTKALVVYNLRRELAVYDRGPRDLAVYAPPIDFVQLWLDMRPHKLVALAHRSLFRDDCHQFEAYLDRRSFVLAVIGANQDPVEYMLVEAFDRSHLPITDLSPREYLTIGEPDIRPEEIGGLVLALVHLVGILVGSVCWLWTRMLKLRPEPVSLSPPVPSEPDLTQELSWPEDEPRDILAGGSGELWMRDINSTMSSVVSPSIYTLAEASWSHPQNTPPLASSIFPDSPKSSLSTSHVARTSGRSGVVVGRSRRWIRKLDE